MNRRPVVLGLNRAADASMCLMDGLGLLISIQKERCTRRKHHWGSLGDIKDVYIPSVLQLRAPIDLVVEC